MRRPAPASHPVALTIAGSDAGGGAGIQADLQTMAAHDAFGTSVVTATTAQNTRGVHGSELLPEPHVRAQFEAVADDFDVRAAKTGMLATASLIETVGDCLAGTEFPVVVDPVMVSATGDRLLDPAAEDAYGALLERATVVTPNADEAAVLTGIEPTDADSMERAARALLEEGADAVLLKGGHVDTDPVRDVLVSREGTTTVTHPRIETDSTHGSGCTLSSAIAARLAHGDPLEVAVRTALDFMERAVRYHHDVGSGPGPVHHVVDLRNAASLGRTVEAVEGLGDALSGTDADRVIGATRFAESAGDTVECPIAGAADSGVTVGRGGDAAAHLLAVRERDPTVRFAATGIEGPAPSSWPVLAAEAGIDPTATDRPPVAIAHGDGRLTVLAADPRTLRERVEGLA